MPLSEKKRKERRILTTIDKAIKNLTVYIEAPGSKMPPERLDAVKLGIEALEQMQRYRKYDQPDKRLPLPGETEESK